MSERLSNEVLNELVARAVLTAKDGGCWVDTETLGRVTNELVDRRVADTKPSPIEQGTLRDEFAMRFAASMINVLGRSTSHGGPIASEDAWWQQVSQSAYRMADAMLAQRAKETEKP